MSACSRKDDRHGFSGLSVVFLPEAIVAVPSMILPFLSIAFASQAATVETGAFVVRELVWRRFRSRG